MHLCRLTQFVSLEHHISQLFHYFYRSFNILSWSWYFVDIKIQSHELWYSISFLVSLYNLYAMLRRTWIVSWILSYWFYSANSTMCSLKGCLYVELSVPSLSPFAILISPFYFLFFGGEDLYRKMQFTVFE